MISQGMLISLLFTLSVGICLFMYVHQKTTNIHKKIENVIQFIKKVEFDVQQTSNIAQHTNEFEPSQDDDNSEYEENKNIYFDVQSSSVSALSPDDVIYLKKQSEEDKVDVSDDDNNEDLDFEELEFEEDDIHEKHELDFVYSEIKEKEEVQNDETNTHQQDDATQLKHLSVSELKQYIKQHNIKHPNLKKLKKKDLIDIIGNYKVSLKENTHEVATEQEQEQENVQEQDDIITSSNIETVVQPDHTFSSSDILQEGEDATIHSTDIN